MDLRDDETLLRAYALKGDEGAFREVVRRYGGLVYAACLRDLRRADLAEDAAQGVFLVLARKSGRVRVKTTLVPWLYATARLVSRGVLRAERRRPTVPLDESLPAPESATDDALFQALDALGGAEREAVVLRFVQGMSLAEVGRAQGVSEDAARMRVQRALKRLRAEYVPALAMPTSLSSRLAALTLPKPNPIMTTPFLLAVSGAAVASGAVFAASRPAPLSPPPVAAKRAVVPQAKTIDESKFKLAKPGSVPPKVAALDKPFTLVYRLKITNLSTKSMRDAAIAERTRELEKEVDEDRKTQAQADEEIARMRAPGRPASATITLAYDGRTMFYEDQGNNPEDPRPTINLFDGKHTTFFSPKVSGGKYESQGGREDGTVQYWTSRMPYVGPSLPYFPVMRGKEVLIIRAYDNKLVYRPYATVVPGPKEVAGKILTGRFDPQDSVVLSKWAPLQGTVVAGSVVWTKRAFETYLAPEDMLKPAWRYEYTLVSARPSADPALFSLATYTQNAMDFSHGGRQRFQFKFDPAKGTLEQQIEAASRRGQ